MIDYLLKFDSAALAQADDIVGAFYSDGWRGDCCIPGVTVTHLPTETALPFWYITISTAEADTALLDHEACVLAVDWAAEPVVLRSSVPDPLEYLASPVFAGRDLVTFLAG